MAAEFAADKLRKKLKKLFALLGSNNAGEREAARCKIDELVAKNKKSWNDLTELMSGGSAQGWQGEHDEEPDGSGGVDASDRPRALDLIRYILQRHLHLTEHQFVALTLWIAHTFLFHQFAVTPRLAVMSPVKGCGKTTLLNLVKALAFRTKKTDHITAAVLFRLIDRDRPTLLLDEADNQDLPTNATLRSVINGGHHCDGKIARYLDGEIVEFSTFAPLAFAAIGKLPYPVMHRSVVINMERNPAARKLTRFDPKTIEVQKQDCDIAYHEVLAWARQCKLNLDPPMPEGLRNRSADNWRVLLSIADACGPPWNRAAREAGIALSKGQDEDLSIMLLSDIRELFDRRATADRLASALIVADLNGLPDALWSEWRGPRDDQAPRRLSQAQMAHMLAPFGIRPKTIWPPRRGISDRSSKGYFRNQFEAAWASYCAGTPAQGSNIRYLRRPGG